MNCPSPASTCTITGDDQEMEAKPSDSSNDEGTIDHVLDILTKYSHPFILVGQVALRWMGSYCGIDPGFDLVLRADQLPSIVTSLIETGYWTIFDPTKDRECFISKDAWRGIDKLTQTRLHEYLCEVEVVLKWEGIEGIGFKYMRLWTDETYHIDIDASPLIEVPQLYPWTPCLVEKEFHPALGRDDGWFYGPPIFDDAAGDDGAGGVFSEFYPPSKGAQNTTPINILSIPAYLDALVYHETHHENSKLYLASVASLQIGNLIKELFLELPHQRGPLLFQVEAETENFLMPYLENWKRLRYYVRLRSGGRVPVNVWDPDSYPKDLESPFIEIFQAGRATLCTPVQHPNRNVRFGQ